MIKKEMKCKNVILFEAILLCFGLAGLQAQTLQDIDGNVYKTVTIGKQIWMAENLKTTKFNDGTSIPLVRENSAWKDMNSPSFCWYNNDATTNKNNYGALYNWYTVNTNKLCPSGWHVPSDAEWTTLRTYLGGDSVAGGKLKETGTTHWKSPNTGATNASGFTALPSGRRTNLGSFGDDGYYGNWWSATEVDSTNAWYYFLNFPSSIIYRGVYFKTDGLSVRCLKDL